MTRLFQKIVHKSYAFIENTLFAHFSFFTKKNTLLLLRIDSIGDYILFRNFIQELKNSEQYKNHKITLCGNTWWKELSEQLDGIFIEQFIWVDYNSMNDNKYRFKLLKKIFFSGFDVVIHPTYSRDIHGDMIVRYSGARYKIGYDGDTIAQPKEVIEHNNSFYTQLITSSYPYRFEFYRNKDFFESLLGKEIKLLRPSIQTTKTEQNTAIFFPGAKDAFRRWSPLYFAQLTKLLAAYYPGLKVVICGSATDSVLANEIIKHSTETVLDHTGKFNLPELINVMAAAKLIVANDSGPFHIATALNKNVVCISNGNNYGRFTPYPPEMKTNSIVLYPPKVLSYNEEDRLHHFYKMVKDIDINDITAEQVFSTIKNHFKLNE